MSYNGTDNGYAVFDRVRIPRTNLLMRHCKVTRDGSYFSSPLRQKLMFGGLLNGRSIIIRCAVFQLAQALTITTRYSTVRQQGSPSALGNEKAIIHYKHQHFRLLSLIARCYITILAWKSANASHAELKARRENGDHSTLPYIHMLMCGLKAWSTQTAADGAEEARKMCGGHGYIIISGLSEIVTSVTATCTLEGENFVMWNQVARYMLKGFGALPVPKDMAYMDCYDFSYQHQACGAKGEQFLDHNVLLEIFKRRAARLAHEVHDQVKASESSSKSRLEAENIHGLQLLVTGRAHIEVFLLSESMTQLAMLPASIPTSIKTVLHRLVSLFALTTIANPIAQFSSSFLGDGYLTNSHLNEIRQQIDILLEALLPDAIALTDAWCFSDASLASAIGCADGDVYTRLLAWTRQLPINVQAKKDGEVFKRGWEEYIKPFLNRDLSHLEVKAKL
jgi:acyl-CoA oxidase